MPRWGRRRELLHEVTGSAGRFKPLELPGLPTCTPESACTQSRQSMPPQLCGRNDGFKPRNEESMSACFESQLPTDEGAGTVALLAPPEARSRLSRKGAELLHAT